MLPGPEEIKIVDSGIRFGAAAEEESHSDAFL